MSGRAWVCRTVEESLGSVSNMRRWAEGTSTEKLRVQTQTASLGFSLALSSARQEGRERREEPRKPGGQSQACSGKELRNVGLGVPMSRAVQATPTVIPNP